jgi:hypothetical protein
VKDQDNLLSTKASSLGLFLPLRKFLQFLLIKRTTNTMAREINAPPTPPLLTHSFDVDNVLSKLTTTEKIDLLSGKVPENLDLKYDFTCAFLAPGKPDCPNIG